MKDGEKGGWAEGEKRGIKHAGAQVKCYRPPPDPCAGSHGGEEMEQDGGLMNAHCRLPRLILSVQTAPPSPPPNTGVRMLQSVGEVFKVSMRVCVGARYVEGKK